MDVQTAHYFQIDLEMVENADFSSIIPRFPFNVKIGLLGCSFYSVIIDKIAPRRGHKGFPNRIFLEKTRYDRIGGRHFTR